MLSVMTIGLKKKNLLVWYKQVLYTAYVQSLLLRFSHCDLFVCLFLSDNITERFN